MASIDKRADGRYRARWREYPGGPQRTRQFARKADAQRFLDAGVPQFGPPKSKAGFRTVPMPEVVSSTLAEHLARYRPGPFGLVFTNTHCNPLTRSTAGEMWRRARVRGGLPDWATFHDLRHFYASLLIGRGCSVKAVQRRLGHQSAVETLDTYGHLWPDSEDETRNAVDQVLASMTVAS